MEERDILVSIASFCDKSLKNTVNDILKKCSNPRRLDIIVINQSEQPEGFEQENVTEIYIDYRKVRGITWARSHVHSYINDNHKYYLMIDAHSLFRQNWDIDLINEIGDEYDVISTFPYSHRYVDWPPCSVNRVDHFTGDGSMRFKGGGVPNEMSLKPSTISGGFCFSHMKLLKDVPINPRAPWNYEEFDLTIRAFLKGYNIRSMYEPPVFHIYHEVHARRGAQPRQVWTTNLIDTYKDEVRSFSDFEVLYGLNYEKKREEAMITIPIAVVNDNFKWQLSLFWYCHLKTYGFTAYRKAHALIVQRNHPSEEAKFNIDDWGLDIPHTITKPFFEVRSDWDDANLPLNIQTSLFQVIDQFDDDQLIELTDCDVGHFKPHPKIEIGDDQMYVDAVYEDWHLKSLSDKKDVIQPYFQNGGSYYNGGFVPIIARAKVFKKILKDWMDIHVDIDRRYPNSLESWWAGMYSLQAACERNKITMIHKDYCYIVDRNGSVKKESYIAHYCCDQLFKKREFYEQFDKIDHLPDNPFYNLIKEWKHNDIYPVQHKQQ